MFERPYQRLLAWQQAHQLCLRIYKAVQQFPPDERYGLTKQMRSSAQSVPTNIAEGNGRRTKKDKAHFLIIAISSLDELHYQCLLARDLGYITNDLFKDLEMQIGRVGYLTSQLRNSFL
ncbi:MAG: four helix bundle protein [Patescibacteria group bacterium]